MDQNRLRRRPQFKAKVAIEALKGDLTLSELASKYDIDPRQIIRWKNQLLDESESIFVHKTTQRRTTTDIEKDEIRRELNVALLNIEYLKNARQVEIETRRNWIETGSGSMLGINEQCELIGLARSSFYYKPCVETLLNIELIKMTR